MNLCNDAVSFSAKMEFTIYQTALGNTLRLNNGLVKCAGKLNVNKASQAIQSPRTVSFFLLISLLDGHSFANVHVKGIIAFKH